MEIYKQYIIRTQEELSAISIQLHYQHRAYRDKIYASLMEMKPGQTFNIPALVDPKNLPLFYKIACLFITENCEYTFSDDYKIIVRNG